MSGASLLGDHLTFAVSHSRTRIAPHRRSARSCPCGHQARLRRQLGPDRIPQVVHAELRRLVGRRDVVRAEHEPVRVPVQHRRRVADGLRRGDGVLRHLVPGNVEVDVAQRRIAQDRFDDFPEPRAALRRAARSPGPAPGGRRGRVPGGPRRSSSSGAGAAGPSSASGRRAPRPPWRTACRCRCAG